MKRKLSILLLTISLVSTTGCNKELAFVDTVKPLTIETSKSMIKETKGTEKENATATAEKNTSSTSKNSAAVSSSKNISKSHVLLVNRSNRLEKSYIPKSLTIPNVRFISYADPKVKKMDATAAKALENLFNTAKKERINLLAVSGYRTYSYQEMLYNNKVASSGRVEADKYVAQPGASEHNTGLAMDVLSDEYSSLDEVFEQTQAYKWLKNNCHKYGFIIRYQKGKENITGYNYEPWHLRYVGISEATEISQKNITLEEYLNKVE